MNTMTEIGFILCYFFFKDYNEIFRVTLISFKWVLHCFNSEKSYLKASSFYKFLQIAELTLLRAERLPLHNH